MYLFIVVTFAFNSNPSVIVYVSLLGSSCWHFVWSRVGCAHSFEVALVLPYFLDLFETAALFAVVVRSTASLNNRDCFILCFLFCWVRWLVYWLLSWSVGWFGYIICFVCLFGSLVGLLAA